MLVTLSAQKKTYNLTVIITNLKNTNGSVEVGLYRNGENFAKVGLTYKKNTNNDYPKSSYRRFLRPRRK